MDRRDFIKIAATTAAAAAIGPAAGTAAVPAVPTRGGELAVADGDGTEDAHGDASGIKVRFLGTGSAQKGVDKAHLWRRRSSVLIDDSFLIDLTSSALDMLPAGFHPTTIFYTHSHGDHFDPAAAIQAGVRRVLVHYTWIDIARQALASAAKAAGRPMPALEPLTVGCHVRVDNLTVTPLPANHATANVMEQPVIFLLQKGPTRLLYATDTSGLTAIASRVGGFVPKSNGPGLTALIMEATLGTKEEHHSLFTHSSLALVERTVRVLTAGGMLHLPQGQPVIITHLAKGNYGGATNAEINASLPAPLQAAYDGMEVLLH